MTSPEHVEHVSRMRVPMFHVDPPITIEDITMAKKIGTPGLMRVLNEAGRLAQIALHKGKPTEALKDSSLILSTTMLAPRAHDMPEEMADRVFDYGLAKLGMDRASQVDMGLEKIDRIDQVWSDLCDGVWERESVRGAPVVAAWIEAIAEIKGASVADVQKSLKGMTDEQKDAIKANPKVAKLAEEIAARRKEDDSSVDLGDLID